MTPEAIPQEAKDAGLPSSVALPNCNVADEEIYRGSEAKSFASYMRVPPLESTGGLTYAEDGPIPVVRRISTTSRATNDVAAAAKDENDQPISNGALNIWVTETALATALNVSFRDTEHGPL